MNKNSPAVQIVHSF